MRRLLTAAAAVAATLIIAPAAYAHTGLERGSPGPGDTVRPGGELIALTFERIDPKAPHEIALLDADEQAQPVGAALAVDNTTVCARVDPLDVGIHAIAYSVTSADGHLVRGTYEFEVVSRRGSLTTRPLRFCPARCRPPPPAPSTALTLAAFHSRWCGSHLPLALSSSALPLSPCAADRPVNPRATAGPIRAADRRSDHRAADATGCAGSPHRRGADLPVPRRTHSW